MNVILAAKDSANECAQDKVYGFRSFLTEMYRRGIPTSVYPADFRAMYDLDDWLGEVVNGGNSQFIGNKRGGATSKLEGIEFLLRSCGVTALAEVAAGVLQWIRNNPEEASRQTGFSGGRAPELDALDKAFWNAGGNGSDLYETLAHALLARSYVRRVPEGELKSALDAEAQRLSQTSLEVQGSIARLVAGKCRQWLSDPMNMGFAIASGKLQYGKLVQLTSVEPFLACLVTPTEGGATHNMGYVRLDRDGLTFKGDQKMEMVDLFVSRAEIRRATEMALAFRLPESVGLRWSKMRRPFKISITNIKVMPGSIWRPNKWRVLWMGGVDWAVKGSPNRSTFAWGAGLVHSETMMQDEIAERFAALGLKVGA